MLLVLKSLLCICTMCVQGHPSLPIGDLTGILLEWILCISYELPCFSLSLGLTGAFLPRGKWSMVSEGDICGPQEHRK